MPAHQPDQQIEVQLGHLCNNRCVFCVSGQLSEQRRAPQLPLDSMLAQIAAAKRNGAKRITLLGGEPTIQRGFLDVLRFAVAQDFAEIVVFTNGVMTPRETFRARVFEVLDGLGAAAQARVIWRFSLQGGNEADHDGTTLNAGSWRRILESLQILQDRGARLTGNMCVVESNYRHVEELADRAAQFGFENLHLDMVRPRDAGDRSDEELRAMLARYTDMAPHFSRLSARADELLGANWDLNFGNVPFCTNLAVAHRIHHDGQDTVTVAADGQGHTQQGFNKYEDKRVDKHKPAGCAQCIFNDSCSGVFDKYRQFHGDREFVPVTAEALWQADAGGRHLPRLLAGPLRALQAKGELTVVLRDERAGRIDVAADGWRLSLGRAGVDTKVSAIAAVSGARLAAAVVAAPQPSAQAERDFLKLWRSLLAAAGDPRPAHDALPALRPAWKAFAAQQAERRAVARWVAPLKLSELAGFTLQSERLREDGATELQFASRAAQIGLVIAARADAQGRLRPHLQHQASDVESSQLQEFSRELGQRLRPVL